MELVSYKKQDLEHIVTEDDSFSSSWKIRPLNDDTNKMREVTENFHILTEDRDSIYENFNNYAIFVQK